MPRATLSDTLDRLKLMIEAGTPIIAIETHEEARALDLVARIVRVIRARNPTKELFIWYDGEDLQRLQALQPFATAPDAEINWLEVPGLPPEANRYNTANDT